MIPKLTLAANLLCRALEASPLTEAAEDMRKATDAYSGFCYEAIDRQASSVRSEARDASARLVHEVGRLKDAFALDQIATAAQWVARAARLAIVEDAGQAMAAATFAIQVLAWREADEVIGAAERLCESSSLGAQSLRAAVVKYRDAAYGKPDVASDTVEAREAENMRAARIFAPRLTEEQKVGLRWFMITVPERCTDRFVQPSMATMNELATFAGCGLIDEARKRAGLTDLGRCVLAVLDEPDAPPHPSHQFTTASDAQPFAGGCSGCACLPGDEEADKPCAPPVAYLSTSEWAMLAQVVNAGDKGLDGVASFGVVTLLVDKGLVVQKRQRKGRLGPMRVMVTPLGSARFKAGRST